MNDSDDPIIKKPDLESLEKHIQLEGRDPPLTVQAPPQRAESPRSIGPVKQFYRDVVDCLTEPRQFFEVRYPKLGLTYALTFGILVSWIAALLDWLTRLIRHETLYDGFLKMREKLQGLPIWKSLPEDFWAQKSATVPSAFPSWLTDVFGVLLSPFQSLAGFCISGVMLFIGAYLLIPKKTDAGQDPIDITHLIKIVAFTSAPHLIASILGFLPLGMGSMIGWIYGIALVMIALSQRYKISNLRALGIIALPSLVGVFILSCFVGVLLAVGYGMFAAMFGGH